MLCAFLHDLQSVRLLYEPHPENRAKILCKSIQFVGILGILFFPRLLKVSAAAKLEARNVTRYTSA